MDELSAVLKARELINKVSPTSLPVSVRAYADQVGAIIHVDEDLKPDEQVTASISMVSYASA